MQANLRENIWAFRLSGDHYVDGWYRSTLDHGCQQSVDRVSAECRQPINWLAGDLIADTWVGRHSTDYRLLLVECRSAATDMSIAGWSRCWSLLLIGTRSQVSLVHMIRKALMVINWLLHVHLIGWPFNRPYSESHLMGGCTRDLTVNGLLQGCVPLNRVYCLPFWHWMNRL